MLNRPSRHQAPALAFLLSVVLALVGFIPTAHAQDSPTDTRPVAAESSGGTVSKAQSDLVVCAKSVCPKGRMTIPVDKSERLVSTLFTSDATNIALLVRPPNDTAYFLSVDGPDNHVAPYGTTEAVWLSTGVRFDIAPSNAAGAGDWRVDLIDPEAKSEVAATAQTTRNGDLFPRVVGEPELSSDGTLEVTAEIIDGQGDSIAAIPSGAQMTALVRDTESGRETPFGLDPTEMGTFAGKAFVGTDFPPAFEVDLRLAVITGLPGQTTTSAFELSAPVPAGGAESDQADTNTAEPPLPAKINSESTGDDAGNRTMLIGSLTILAIAAIAWWVRTARNAVFHTHETHVVELPIVIRVNGEIDRCGELAGPIAILPEDLVPLDVGQRQHSLKVAGLKLSIFLDRRLHPNAEGLVSANKRLTGSLGRVLRGNTSTARIGLDLRREWVFELDEETSLNATDIAHRGDVYGRLILFLTPHHLDYPPDDFADSLQEVLPIRARELLIDLRLASAVDTEDQNMLGFIEDLRSSQ